MNAQSKITAARTELVLSQPFWGSLVLGLKMKEDATCPTAWTNGREIGYNPRFIDTLTVTETQALLAHEVSHVANGHPWRRDGRDMQRWNTSCDLAINGDLSDAGFKLPKGGLMPDSIQVGKSSEWIYARLPESPNGNGGGSGQGNGSQDGNGDPAGEVRDAPTGPDEDGDPAPSQEDWKQRTAAAAQSAKMQGKMPAGMQRTIEQALRPRIDVRSLLLRFFSERSTGDYSWAMPSRRYLPMGIFLPSLESKSLGEIALLIDTSGSISSVALQFARGILEQVLEELNPAGVTVYMVDTRVHTIHRMGQGEPLTWEPKGGGGTDFTSAFPLMANSDYPPVCIVGISDLQATFGPAPSVPVLWLTDQENCTAPWGEVVYVDR